MFHILYTVTAAQEGPGIVIAHPSQDVELLCTVTESSGSQTTGWLVNNEGPYRISAIRSGILTGHTAILDSTNLIVENIMMNDVRNDSEYRCVIIEARLFIIEESDPIFLYVTGEYVRMYMHINRHIVDDKSFEGENFHGLSHSLVM